MMYLPDGLAELLVVFVGTCIVSRVVIGIAKSYQRCLSDKRRRRTNPPPSLPHLPLIGSLPFLPDFQEWAAYFAEKSKVKGDVFAFHLGPRYAVVLNSAKVIHEAFVTKALDFSNRPELYTDTSALNVHLKGIADRQYNDEFRRQHQLILSILKDLGFGRDVIQSRIQAEVSSLIAKLRKDGAGGRVAISPKRLVANNIMRVISGIVFGRTDFDDDTVDGLIHHNVQFITESINTTVIKFFPLLRFVPSKWFAFRRAVDHVKHSYRFIERNIEDCPDDSFVGQYVDREGASLDREQLFYVVRDLVIAGSETTATTVMWCIVLLAGTEGGRDVQDEMRRDVDSVIPLRDRLPCLEDRRRTPFVEACILEVMRYRTLLPLGAVHLTSRDTCVAGYDIPAGTWIIPNQFSAHMDRSVWGDPEVFRPQRFLDESGNFINKDLIIPFSAGKRSCLGEALARQELFLFIAGLVQNFVIEPPVGQEVIERQGVLGFTFSPEYFEVRFTPREW